MTIKTVSKRISVTFAAELLEELNRYVLPAKRNRAIIQATEQWLKQMRLKQVLAELRQKPAWAEEDHPDLVTVEQVNDYVNQLRQQWLPQVWTDNSTVKKV